MISSKVTYILVRYVMTGIPVKSDYGIYILGKNRHVTSKTGKRKFTIQTLFINIKMASQNPVYCRNVAKALGIQSHKCQRKYFLDKNRARHKLRAYNINDPSDREKVVQLLSYDW